jgi:ribonuclease HII
MPDFSIEDGFKGAVIGVDEVGRGPLAGPVVAGAAVFLHRPAALWCARVRDSKKLTEKQRTALFAEMKSGDIGGGKMLWAIGSASVAEIDAVNILNATYLAMERAVLQVVKILEGQGQACVGILVDGNRLPKWQAPDLWPIAAMPVVKGDDKSLSIACAAIAAKCTRDALMRELSAAYPGYGWEKNAGYGTKQHKNGLTEYGVTPHHRRSFKPIADLIDNRDSI